MSIELIPKQVHVNDPGFMQAKKLLKTAFPKKEQTPVFLLLIGTLKKTIHFVAFYDNENFAGLLYTIENDEYYFILYLAVNQEMRSKGYGGEILNYAYAQAGKRNIILNVERLDAAADNYEQRLKRVSFYEKNGICRTGYGFSSGGVEYSVLASDTKTFDPSECKKFMIFNMSKKN
jgi:GNAT superfamily N-acetyltransferase